MMFTESRSRTSPVLDVSKGCPVGTDLYYECFRCGEILESLPAAAATCKCGNIEIYPEDCRMGIESPADARLLSRAAKIARELLRLPGRFHDIGTVGFGKLLKETGYWDAPDAVTEGVIREVLAEHPEFILDWRIWSEDKRTSDCWYWVGDAK